MMEIALLENLQREDLNAVEEAIAYRKLIEELSITQEELAKRLGKSRSHITNMLGILSLPEEVKDMIMDEKITMSHARVLSKMKDTDKIKELAQRIAMENLSVRQVENISIDSLYEKKKKIKRRENPVNEYQIIEEELAEKLGTKVKIKNNKVEISFVNNNDLNRLLEMIGYKN